MFILILMEYSSEKMTIMEQSSEKTTYEAPTSLTDIEALDSTSDGVCAVVGDIVSDVVVFKLLLLLLLLLATRW